MRRPPRPSTVASPATISAIVPRTPSSGATTGSPAASGAVSASGSSSRASEREARTARSDAAPSLRSRSASFFCAAGVVARPRSRSSFRAALISARSSSSSARTPGELRLGLRQRALPLGRRRRPHLLDLVLEALGGALRLEARRLRLLPLGGGGSRSSLRLPRGRLCLRDELGHLQPLRRDPVARGRDDRRGQPEPLGRLQRVRRTRPTERHRVERLVRLRDRSRWRRSRRRRRRSPTPSAPRSGSSSR